MAILPISRYEQILVSPQTWGQWPESATVRNVDFLILIARYFTMDFTASNTW